MKPLGPPFWFGLAFGVGLGAFIAFTLVETNVVSSAVGGGASLGRAVAALVGVCAVVAGVAWRRRGPAEPGAAADGGGMIRSGTTSSPGAAALLSWVVRRRRYNGIAMNISRAIAVLVCLGGAVPAWAGSGDAAPSLEEDFQCLQGKWVKRAPGEEWTLNVDANPRAFQLAISVSEPAFTAARTGFLSGVQEDARGRYFEIGAGPSLPQRIYYRFDQDNLVLDIPEGPVRGQHTLVRERDAAPPNTAWVIGVVILGVVVLIAAVILFRSRTRKAAEPGAAADRGGR